MLWKDRMWIFRMFMGLTLVAPLAYAFFFLETQSHFKSSIYLLESYIFSMIVCSGGFSFMCYDNFFFIKCDQENL